MLDLLFRAVALAMGVAVVVLSILKELSAESGMTMLGIGLVCTGISLLNNRA